MAGIDILETRIEQVLKEFGKPTEMEDSPPVPFGKSEIVGTRRYIWRKRNLTIEVDSYYSKKPIFAGDRHKAIIMVTVEGTDGSVGRSGRGLKLGHSFADVTRIYGRRFHRKGSSLSVQWGDGTTLDVEFDERGVVKRLALSASE